MNIDKMPAEMRQLMAETSVDIHPKCQWSLPIYNEQYSDQLDCIDKDV